MLIAGYFSKRLLKGWFLDISLRSTLVIPLGGQGTEYTKFAIKLSRGVFIPDSAALLISIRISLKVSKNGCLDKIHIDFSMKYCPLYKGNILKVSSFSSLISSTKLLEFWLDKFFYTISSSELSSSY